MPEYGAQYTYECMMVEKCLREFIIDQAKAIYGQRYPKGHDWAVVIAQDKDSIHHKYKGHVIVYTKPDSLSNRVLLESSKGAYPKVLMVLWDLLEELQQKMNGIVHN